MYESFRRTPEFPLAFSCTDLGGHISHMYAMNAEYRAHDYLLEKSYYRFSDVGFALCLAHSEAELLVLDKTFELLLDIAFGRW